MSFTKNISPSKWQGKTWNAIGDSITEPNSRTNINYHGYIKQKIGCNVNNYGVSGTGYFTPSTNGGTNQIPNRISNMSNSADLITVFAGTNDWSQVGKTLVMGSFGDTDSNVSFYGAVDNVISQLITKHPTKTIAVFTPLPRSNSFNGAVNSAGVSLQQISDAIIQVCAKYSIPVLDLYRCSGLFPWNTDANNYYFTAPGSGSPDGLHPNDLGHQKIADKILAFLNTL